MPASAKIALACLLLAGILRAFYGRPPSGERRREAVAAAAVGAEAYVMAVVVAMTQHAGVAQGLIAIAVESLSLAAWLARGRDDRRGDEPEREPDPPIDWARFDRERERWSRPRRPTPV